MAYPAPVAAALSGNTVRQLSYWRSEKATRGPLLTPEIEGASGRILYSFRDVIALRAVAYLREEHSLQKVRRAVGTLRDIGDRDHLARYRLVSVGDSIVVAHDEQHATDLLRAPGAGRMLAVLHDIFDPFETVRGETVVSLYSPREHLQVDPEIRGGYPVIHDTRVPYDQVASLVADGVAPGDIAEFYPGVRAEAALDAHDFGQQVERLAA